MTILWAMTTAAWACGGLVCDFSVPVVQDGERIVFAIDDEAGFVEAHVQITYEGPAERFGWIVPVAQEPDLFVSPQALFDILATNTAPRYSRIRVSEGTCHNGRSLFPLFGGIPTFDQEPAAAAPLEPGGGVVVTSQQRVGPYDTTVLQASSSEALRAFLDDNAYDIPSTLDPALAPYIADGAYFVAVRLAKDTDAGDIAPLGMRYAGTEASIPIQLTAIAANDDMPLEVYVLGRHRAVPTSYLHVHLNEAAIDWWNSASNYADVRNRAADEAGGNAFVTEFAGEPPPQLLPNGMADRLARLGEATTVVEWSTVVGQLAFLYDARMLDIIAELVDLQDGSDVLGYLSDPENRDGWRGNRPFDPAMATKVFGEEIMTPLERADALLDAPMVTRLTSALSANEMTVDPVFALNPDLTEPISNVHTADEVFDCEPNRRWERADRRLELADGRVLRLPSQRSIDGTELDFLATQGAVAAQIVEQMSADGEPEVLFDYTPELFDLAEATNAEFGGCGGCTSTGPGSGLALGPWAFGLLAILLRRRG